MELYDRIIETLILIFVIGSFCLEWRFGQAREKQRIKSTVTRLLKSLGVKV